MKYNTQKRPLVYSEYGRGIQEMVDFTVNIPSKVARNRAAQTILKFMQVLNPQVRELDDYMHKLYDQLIIMSDYKLDIDNPYLYTVRTEIVQDGVEFFRTIGILYDDAENGDPAFGHKKNLLLPAAKRRQ